MGKVKFLPKQYYVSQSHLSENNLKYAQKAYIALINSRNDSITSIMLGSVMIDNFFRDALWCILPAEMSHLTDINIKLKTSTITSFVRWRKQTTSSLAQNDEFHTRSHYLSSLLINKLILKSSTITSSFARQNKHTTREHDAPYYNL